MAVSPTRYAQPENLCRTFTLKTFVCANDRVLTQPRHKMSRNFMYVPRFMVVMANIREKSEYRIQETEYCRGGPERLPVGRQVRPKLYYHIRYDVFTQSRYI